MLWVFLRASFPWEVSGVQTTHVRVEESAERCVGRSLRWLLRELPTQPSDGPANLDRVLASPEQMPEGVSHVALPSQTGLGPRASGGRRQSSALSLGRLSPAVGKPGWGLDGGSQAGQGLPHSVHHSPSFQYLEGPST